MSAASAGEEGRGAAEAVLPGAAGLFTAAVRTAVLHPI